MKTMFFFVLVFLNASLASAESVAGHSSTKLPNLRSGELYEELIDSLWKTVSPARLPATRESLNDYFNGALKLRSEFIFNATEINDLGSAKELKVQGEIHSSIDRGSVLRPLILASCSFEFIGIDGEWKTSFEPTDCKYNEWL